MCLAIAARIIRLEGAFAEVDMLGFQSQVYIGLIEEAAEGDFVLVHAGCAIEKVDAEAFDACTRLCMELAEVQQDEA